MLIVNLFGVLQLILASRKPEAKRFKRWVTHEVLPAIRKTGGYSLIPSRVHRERKRLGSDFETAIARCEQRDTNKDSWDWLNGRKATPVQRAEWNNAPHEGIFGQTAGAMRRELDIPKGGTPLDRMASLPLIINSHAKAVARMKADEEQWGLDDATDFAKRTASELARADEARMGAGFRFGLSDDRDRGRQVYGMVRLALRGPSESVPS
jgi:hypothetical protein